MAKSVDKKLKVVQLKKEERISSANSKSSKMSSDERNKSERNSGKVGGRTRLNDQQVKLLINKRYNPLGEAINEE